MRVKGSDYGVKGIVAKLVKVQKETPVAAAFGQYEAMQDVMVEAKDRAPKLTGDMALSGYVTPPDVKASGVSKVEAGFGGKSEVYVNRQHWSVELRHPNGGEALFFQNAVDNNVDHVKVVIEKHIRLFIETGRTSFPGKKVPTSPFG